MTIPVRHETEVDDWTRYGSAHGDAVGDVGDVRGRASSRQGASAPDAIRDDPFRDYRSEGTGGRVRRVGEDRRRFSVPRSRANLAGAAVAVAAMAGLALLFNVRASEIKPTAPPSPSEPLASVSVAPSATEAAAIRMGHAGFVVQLPFEAVIPSRDFLPYDGQNVFVAGDGGVTVIDPATGQFVANYGGAAYPSRLRKWVFDGGLWLSTWASNDPYCGPDCWPLAMTYRVDPATGAVTLKLGETYLVGAGFDGVWVASGNTVSRIDPTTGEVLATVPWLTSGEPRVGCGSLWSIRQDPGGTQSLLSLVVDSTTGVASTPVSLGSAVASGPIAVEGQCWAMSGSDAASNAAYKSPVQITWLNPDGSIFDTRTSSDGVVVMDGEFWTYKGDGTLQRLDVPSGVTYGRRFQLAIEPSGGDVSGLFAAGGFVWLREAGDQLVVFDIRTGASAANS